MPSQRVKDWGGRRACRRGCQPSHEEVRGTTGSQQVVTPSVPVPDELEAVPARRRRQAALLADLDVDDVTDGNDGR
jgi:hypothetical protein